MSSTRNEMDKEEIRVAVNGLLRQVNSYSTEFLSDPLIQNQFREEYRFLGKCLLDDYQNGVLAKNRIVKLVKRERQSLIDQSLELGKYGIGLIAGIGQLSTGYGLCITSSIFSFAGASWCASTGAPMMLHGGNNIYENSYNMTGNIVQNWQGRYTGHYGDNTGIVKKGYRYAAQKLGLEVRDGDVAYATVDIATSAYGFVNTLKPAVNATISNVKQFKLYYYGAQDYIKGWKTMSRSALTVEGMADIETIRSAAYPYFHDEEK
ncbi:DUF4225 domain-containing protein [Vibrio sp. AK197]